MVGWGRGGTGRLSCLWLVILLKILAGFKGVGFFRGIEGGS